MSNDGRSIGEHLRDIEAAVKPDSRADDATRETERGHERGSAATNQARSEERPSQQRGRGVDKRESRG